MAASLYSCPAFVKLNCKLSTIRSKVSNTLLLLFDSVAEEDNQRTHFFALPANTSLYIAIFTTLVFQSFWLPYKQRKM